MNGSFYEIVKRICEELNIEYKVLSKGWIIMLQKNNKTRFIAGYKFDLNKHGLGLVFDDKYALYEALKHLNINIIEHNLVYGINNKNDYALSCNNIEYLMDLFNKYNNDVVLKINNGTCGNDVYHITDKEELKEKYLKISNRTNSLSLCPYYDIENEYRVVLLDKKVRLIYKKEKPMVIGDGVSTIKELLIKFNKNYFNKVEDDKLNKVLNKNEVYLYDWKFNLSKGARINEEVSIKDKENILNIINKINENLDLGFCSVDVIKSDNKYYVLEINSGVMMKNYIKQAKDGYKIVYNLYKDAIIKMFE